MKIVEDQDDRTIAGGVPKQSRDRIEEFETGTIEFVVGQVGQLRKNVADFRKHLRQVRPRRVRRACEGRRARDPSGGSAPPGARASRPAPRLPPSIGPRPPGHRALALRQRTRPRGASCPCRLRPTAGPGDRGRVTHWRALRAGRPTLARGRRAFRHGCAPLVTHPQARPSRSRDLRPQEYVPRGAPVTTPCRARPGRAAVPGRVRDASTQAEQSRIVPHHRKHPRGAQENGGGLQKGRLATLNIDEATRLPRVVRPAGEAAAGAHPWAPGHRRRRTWTTVFNPGVSTLDRLVELTHEVDFAAFIFAQDDWTSRAHRPSRRRAGLRRVTTSSSRPGCSAARWAYDEPSSSTRRARSSRPSSWD